jgi:tetratricopeptide (TPR) repeat protein
MQNSLLHKWLSHHLSVFSVISVVIYTTLDAQAEAKSLKALYNSLDPTSIPQHLAFYELYSTTPEGQKALQDLYRLLTAGSSTSTQIALQASFSSALDGIIHLVNKTRNDPVPDLSDSELQLIDQLAAHLPNRQLAGYGALSEEHVLNLAHQQIDLSRALLLSQLGHSSDAIRKIRCYEAVIDLMALQILSRLPSNAEPKDKIREMNTLIFEEIGFRFPPRSTFSKDVDQYTFLSSVLDSNRGVCLGVSILYLALAQRLHLNLEIVTPPGHIFVRYSRGNEQINIETTARGINLPDSEYLGVDTRSLQKRHLKQVVGMAHFNQAAVFWERQEYDKALAAYTTAERYQPQDKQLMELKGCCALIQGDEALGENLLQQVKDHLPEDAVSKHTIARDYLSHAVGVDGIKSLFTPMDDTREALLARKNDLEKVVEKYPKFREGLFTLAGTWLQLHRMGEALDALKRYHEIDSENATVEYYLAVIHTERMDYNQAWKHLLLAEELTQRRQHTPKALSELRRALSRLCPE